MKTLRYTVEHIDFWADIYLEKRLQGRGVNFLKFLETPRLYMNLLAIGEVQSPPAEQNFLPLLPAQERVKQRLEAHESIQSIGHQLQEELMPEAAHVRNGAAVEPLHHHRVVRHRRNSHFRPLRSGMPS